MTSELKKILKDVKDELQEIIDDQGILVIPFDDPCALNSLQEFIDELITS